MGRAEQALTRLFTSARVRQDDVSALLLRPLSGSYEDRIAGLRGRVAVPVAEGRRVGEEGVDLDDHVGRAEPIQGVGDLFL